MTADALDTAKEHLTTAVDSVRDFAPGSDRPRQGPSR